jgi:hypothetical protein
MNHDDVIPPLSELDTTVTEIKTQVTAIASPGGRLISIALVAAEPWEITEDFMDRDAGARYDGVITFDAEWILLVENKPNQNDADVRDCSREGRPLRQMKPDLPGGSEVLVVPRGVVVSWRDIIDRLSGLVQRSLVYGAERALVEDFFAYVDKHFSHLNPFNRLGLCKDNEYLLNRRCHEIMEGLNLGPVVPRRGAGRGIRLDLGAVQEIYVSAKMSEEENWWIALGMWPGDNLTQAANFYATLHRNEFLNLQANGWSLTPNMHFTHARKELVGNLVCPMNIADYLDFWLSGRRPIRQVPREETDFSELFEEMIREGLISRDDLDALNRNFTETNRQHIKPTPGVKMVFRWDKAEAIDLDARAEFAADVRNRINEAVATWGQALPEAENE